jgi:GNAT superfamily N-acetyltransferase
MTDKQAFQDAGVCASPAGASDHINWLYGFLRGRQLEGTDPGDAQTGVWPITGMRVFCGWGTILEADWPDRVFPDTWLPAEPPGLDAKAKALRTHHYQRIRSARECCIMLGHMLPVQAALEITDQWFEAENGVIRMPGPEEQFVGSHCVLIIGFDPLHFGFTFENSWGRQWGNRGFGLLPLEYFDKYLVSAWAMHGMGPLPHYFKCHGINTVSWMALDCLGNSLHGGDAIHGREVYDGSNDERIGWTFAVHREGFLNVEELFVRPQYRGHGHGSQLVEMLLELAAKLKRPLRLWIPFADWTPSNLPLVEAIVDKLGLRLFHADVRWAAAMALDPSALPPTHQTEVECRET